MADVPPFSPTVALLTVVARWQEALAAELAPLSLTTRKYGLLGHIRAMPGISFSELARRSRISVPSAHTAVAAFVSDGLVRDGTARAGAASHLAVTDEGEHVLAEAATRLAEVDAQFAAQFPELAEALRISVPRMLNR